MFRPRIDRSVTRLTGAIVLLGTLVAGACGPRELQLPEPRPLIVSSGARLSPDAEELTPTYEWVDRQIENIDLDPSFYVSVTPTSSDVYPWETMEINVDTVSLQYRRSSPDVAQVYQIYGHLHLMAEMDRLEEWAPEAVGLEGWELESAIIHRMADAWLLGRSSFDFAPYEMLDEMIYADEAGLLDAFVLTIRGWEFPEAEAAWLAENPDGPEEVRAWYRETFGRELQRGT